MIPFKVYFFLPPLFFFPHRFFEDCAGAWTILSKLTSLPSPSTISASIAVIGLTSSGPFTDPKPVGLSLFVTGDQSDEVPISGIETAAEADVDASTAVLGSELRI